MTDEIRLPAQNYFVDRDHRHVYRILAGDEVLAAGLPSVTTVLNTIAKPALQQWVANTVADSAAAVVAKWMNRKVTQELVDAVTSSRTAAVAIKEAAASRGTDVHKRLESEALNKESKVNTALRSRGLTPIAVEVPVASRHYRYGGTIDCVCWDHTVHGYALVDWKTSKSVYPDYAMQLAGYAVAFDEMFNHTPLALKVVHINPDDMSCAIYSVRDVERAIDGFLSALHLTEVIEELVHTWSRESGTFEI